MAQLFSNIVRSLEAALLEEGLNGDLDYVRIEDLNIVRPGQAVVPRLRRLGSIAWPRCLQSLQDMLAASAGAAIVPLPLMHDG